MFKANNMISSGWQFGSKITSPKNFRLSIFSPKSAEKSIKTEECCRVSGHVDSIKLTVYFVMSCNRFALLISTYM